MSQDFLSKFKFYQDIQLWPKAADFNYEGWLENFDNSERPLAERILNFFVYFPDDIINQLFRTVVGRAGYFFKKFDSTWCNESFSNNCWYSFVPGEEPNPSDSGYIYNRKVKEVLGVPQVRLKTFGQMLQLLDEATEPQNVILTDDFVGSGVQCENAWNKQLFDNYPKSLRQVVETGRHRVIYVPLIVNERGKYKISGLCDGLGLEFAYELGSEWNLFLPNCPCWENDAQLYKDGVALIREKSLTIGIPDDNTVCSVKGFNGQGLALGFSNGIPDACPGFFFKETENWVPLKVKFLKRG